MSNKRSHRKSSSLNDLQYHQTLRLPLMHDHDEVFRELCRFIHPQSVMKVIFEYHNPGITAPL